MTVWLDVAGRPKSWVQFHRGILHNLKESAGTNSNETGTSVKGFPYWRQIDRMNCETNS